MDATIGLKYCGHCQPHLQMSEFARRLRDTFQHVKFVSWDDGAAYSHLLILNACPAMCVRLTDFTGPTCILGSNSLNFNMQDSEEALFAATAQWIADNITA